MRMLTISPRLLLHPKYKANQQVSQRSQLASLEQRVTAKSWKNDSQAWGQQRLYMEELLESDRIGLYPSSHVY